MQRENYLLYICSGNCGQKKLPLGGVNGTGGVGYGARGTGIAVPAALSEDAARGDLADSGGYQASETGCFALHARGANERARKSSAVNSEISKSCKQNIH